MTQFAISDLILGCLIENKIRMFTPNEWTSSPFARTTDGKLIEDVIMDKRFWKSIVICFKGAYPLIEVFRLVDSNESQSWGSWTELNRAYKVPSMLSKKAKLSTLV